MNNSNSSEQSFHKLADLMTIVRKKVNAETDTVWSRYESPQHLIDDLDQIITKLQKHDTGILPKTDILFAPTGALQEISISNGWGDEFAIIAEQFDKLYAQIKVA